MKANENSLDYTDTSKQVGDPEHLKVFADQDAANAWFKQHDPEGVAFEYPVIGVTARAQARVDEERRGLSHPQRAEGKRPLDATFSTGR